MIQDIAPVKPELDRFDKKDIQKKEEENKDLRKAAKDKLKL